MKKLRIVKLLVVLCLVIALIPVAAFAAETGWVENADGTKSYVKENGELVKGQIIQLGDYYYGFDSEGIMYEDEEFYYNGGHYRAKVGGPLYNNEWYYPEPETDPTRRFYYGEMGRSDNELQTIDGILYYFGYKGEVLRDKFIQRTYLENGVPIKEHYYCDENGAAILLKNNQWTLLPNGKKVYVGNEGIAKSCMRTIDGVRYLFGSDNYPLEANGELYLRDPETENFHYFRAKEGGVAYVNEWYVPDPENDPYNRYYYGEGGRSAQGNTTIDGVEYFFGNNGLVYRYIHWFDSSTGKHTYSDEDGAIIVLNADGWTELPSGRKIYIKDDFVPKERVYNVDGVDYIFDSRNLLAELNYTVDSYDYITGKNYHYRAKADGTPYKDTWLQPYLNDTNCTDEDRNRTYYYGADGKSAIGYTKIDENYYYFDTDGVMKRNCSFDVYETVENGNEILVHYTCDENGITTKQLDSGYWKKAKDGVSWSYVQENGELVKGRIIQLGDYYYGFDSEGVMYEDEEFYYNGGHYRAKVGGPLYNNEWYQPDPDHYPNLWYLYREGGAAASGLEQLDENTYRYFFSDGSMACNQLIVSNGTYFMGSDGLGYKLNKGWNLLPCDLWAYVTPYGGAYRYTVVEIDGVLYGFDGIGYMYDDIGFMHNGYDYRAKPGGALYANEWVQPFTDSPIEELRDDWCYYRENGRAYTGFTVLDGVTYLFKTDGRMATETFYYKQEYDPAVGKFVPVTYYFGSNGAGVKVTDNAWNQLSDGTWIYMKDGALQTGWLQLGDTWYYLKDNGVMATGWLQLGDSWYYLQDSGAMAIGWLQLGDTWYYLKDNGVMATGWLQLGSTYYYLQDSGAMATGWLQLGDTWYYLDASGAMATGRVTVDGKEHDFSDSGVWLGEVVKYTGWVSENGTWYYYDAEGNPYEGWLQWDGKWYKFDENGKMRTGLVSDPNGYYYMNADGTMHTGWLQVEGYWYYFNENGTMHFGWLNLDGTWYAFNGFGMLLVGWFHDGAGNEYYSDSSGAMVTGQQYIDGRWHVFDSSGVKIS